MSHRSVWQSDLEGSSLCTWNRSSCTHLQTFHLGKQVRFSLRLAPWQSWIMDSLPWIRGSRFWIPIFFLWNLDSGFQSLVGFRIPGYGFQSFSVEPGFWIPIFSGVPHSLCCIRIPKPRIWDSTSKLFPDSESHKQKFTGFRNPDSLSWGNKASERVLQRARQQGHRRIQSTFCQGFMFFLVGSFCLLLLLFFFFCHKAAIRSWVQGHLMHELNLCAINIRKIWFNPIYSIKRCLRFNVANGSKLPINAALKNAPLLIRGVWRLFKVIFTIQTFYMIRCRQKGRHWNFKHLFVLNIISKWFTQDLP